MLSLPLEREGFHFMSTNQTASYGLHLWEPGDDFLREEFNENTQVLEEALAQKCGAVFGSYTGDDTTNRTIYLGFRPRAVLLASKFGLLGDPNWSSYGLGGLFFSGMTLNAFQLTDTGFCVSSPPSQGNVTPNSSVFSPYYYIAFR